MPKPIYAAETSVSTEQSRAEIERTLSRYGADAFAYSIDGPLAKIAFRMDGRHYRFSLTLPERTADEFCTYMQGRTKFARTESAALAKWEQACRQRWRALLLVIKAKLEAVSIGITTMEDEFLAAMVLSNGQTMGEWAGPEIEKIYRLGHMPKGLLLEGPR